jgi:hypothetical protein
MALCKFMSKIMYGPCFCIGLFAMNQQILFIIVLILFVVTVIFVIVYTNTGNRFKK